MEKCSESVKDAQEKLERAEKKATGVSVDWGCGRISALESPRCWGMEGTFFTRTKGFLAGTQAKQAGTNNSRQWSRVKAHLPLPQRDIALQFHWVPALRMYSDQTMSRGGG